MNRLKMLAVPLAFLVMVSISWLGQAPSLLAKPPQSMPASRLVHSFESLLGQQVLLLHSFEMLVGQFKEPPAELLFSYEDLLHRQVDLLHSYEDLAWPLVCNSDKKPELEVVASFEKLLHGQVTLLASFEALVGRHAMLPEKLVESVEDLLHSQADLVHGFEAILHCLVEVQHLAPKDLYPFMVSFEKLIREQTELLKNFAALIKGAPVEGPELSFEPHHMMPPQMEQEEEAELPSLDELKDFARHGMDMVQQGRMREIYPALADLLGRFGLKLERFRQVTLTMRAAGMDAAARRDAQRAEFRSKLMQLQSELLKNSLAVQLEVMADAPEMFQVTVENRGPFTVSMATLLLFEGPRMIYSQSLGTLGPGERRSFTVKVNAGDLAQVRGMASGFIDFITRLMAMTM